MDSFVVILYVIARTHPFDIATSNIHHTTLIVSVSFYPFIKNTDIKLIILADRIQRQPTAHTEVLDDVVERRSRNSRRCGHLVDRRSSSRLLAFCQGNDDGGDDPKESSEKDESHPTHTNAHRGAK